MSERTELEPLVSPWRLLLLGLSLVVLGWLWGLALDSAAPGLRLLTLAAGLAAIGFTLTIYLPRAQPTLEGRLLCAGLWLLGALATYLAGVGLGSHFDSMVLLSHFLALAAFIAAIITALPPAWRLLGGTALIVLHFAAIATAVAVVPPPEGPPPYLANHLWHRYSRSWLQLTGLNNGYHFYAPEPGPCALVWFRVEFEDGASTWVRIPNHAKVSSHLERRRLGSLATSLAQSEPIQPGRLDELLRRRVDAGRTHNPPIPLADAPPHTQIHQPSQYVNLLLSSFVRRVARSTAHPKGAASPVRAVKVYRVEYMNPPVQHFQAGRDPLDPTLYTAVYMGEYDPEGKLRPYYTYWLPPVVPVAIPIKVDQDPFLYWQIPIVQMPEQQDAPAEVGPSQRQGEPGIWRSQGKIINYVRIHAGDRHDLESLP